MPDGGSPPHRARAVLAAIAPAVLVVAAALAATALGVDEERMRLWIPPLAR